MIDFNSNCISKETSQFSFFSFIIQQPSNNLKGFLLETMCTVQLFLSSLTSEVKLSRNDLKEIIRIAANNVNNDSYNEYINRNAISYQIIVKEHDVKFKILPLDIMKEFLKVAKEVVQDNAEKDPAAMRIHLNYQDFLKKAIDITKYQELGYLNAREMAKNG